MIFCQCWWRGVVTLRQKRVKISHLESRKIIDSNVPAGRGHVSSQQVPLNQSGLLLVAGGGV